VKRKTWSGISIVYWIRYEYIYYINSIHIWSNIFTLLLLLLFFKHLPVSIYYLLWFGNSSIKFSYRIRILLYTYYTHIPLRKAQFYDSTYYYYFTRCILLLLEYVRITLEQNIETWLHSFWYLYEYWKKL